MSFSNLIRYVEKESVIHSLDPRVKFLYVISIVFSISFLFKIEFIIPVTLLSLVIYALAKIPFREVKNTWKFILIVIIVLSFLNLLFLSILHPKEGKTIIEIVGVKITQEAIYSALLPTIKLLTVAIATITLIFTTHPSLYAPAIAKLGVPYKIAYVVDLALRYIPVFLKDMETTLYAQMARGYRPKGGKNPLGRILSVVPLIIPVSISATLSIYDIADAMELRAFGSKPCHTWYRELKLRKQDFLLMTLVIVIIFYTFTIIKLA